MKTKTILVASLILLSGTSTTFGKSTILTWMKDMYNQKSIKPQEAGSVTAFPAGVVSVDGKYYTPEEEKATWIGIEMNPETATKNPVPADAASLTRGKQKFTTFCSACHGAGNVRAENGLAASTVNAKGMIAPVITDLAPSFSDGYIYNKVKFGGAVMPPLGYATTPRERWDIVNYIRTLEVK